jgi:hypothetical protein
MFTTDWLVPAAGFQLADRKPDLGLGSISRAKKGRYLIPLISASQPRRYDIFSRPALFRTFAEIDATEAGLVDFANEFGFLGGPYTQKVLEPDPVRAGQFWAGPGERAADWFREIEWMRHAVHDLWGNLKAGYAAKLKRFIGWENVKGGSRAFYRKPPVTSIVAVLSDDEPFSPIRKGDILRPAHLALLKIVDDQLARYPVRGLLRDTSTEKPTASLSIKTDSLLSALWFQFAQAIADNPEFRRCAECRHYFQITTEKRADARFCSPACRLRAYRKRK